MVGVGSASRAGPARRLADLDRLGDRVTERGPLADAKLAQRQLDELAVARRRRYDAGGAREGDDADAVRVGRLREELADRLPGGFHPGGQDVLRGHGARCVDGEHDRRVLAGYRDLGLGPREGDQQRRERDEQDRRRHVPQPARLLVDDVRKQCGGGELGSHSRPAAVVHDVQGDDRRHGQQGEEEERRLEAHRLRDLVRRKAASVRSQSPEVESTT